MSQVTAAHLKTELDEIPQRVRDEGEQVDIPLLTWDRDQASRVGDVVTAAAPGELDDAF